MSDETDSPDIDLAEPLAIDGHVCLVVRSEHHELIIPMTPALADEYADKIHACACAARKQRPEMVT